MRVAICPDPFKGTFTAGEVARLFARGVRRAAPGAEVMLRPMSDGGAGLLGALAAAGAATLRLCRVAGPLGVKRTACFGLADSGRTAVIEAAEAAGLTLIPPDRRDPRRASSFGVGELVLRAARLGPRTIVVGLGGTGTNDGGMGFARAIGVRFFDRDGHEASRLLDIPARLDATGIDPGVRRARVLVASDVTNPLTGRLGATRVFGPQKGVTKEGVAELDAAMRNFGRLLSRHCGQDVERMPGVGAAGGLGAALVAFLDATIVPGAEWVAKRIALDSAIRRADLVITGEGRIDSQTLHGKTALGVLRHARRFRKPVIAIGGSLGPGAARLRRAGASMVVAAASPGRVASGEDLERAAEMAVLDWLELERG